MKNKTADFLVEIGTEELPPKALLALMQSFADSLGALLAQNRLACAAVQGYASPRRLAVLVNDLALSQENREVEAKGPPVSVAFDDKGNAKPAAMAFAKKCGVEVAELQRVATDKGEWLSYTSMEQGVAAAALLPQLVAEALQQLPIPRRMRWGDSDAEFVRPVHWALMLHGDNVVEGSVMGLKAGRVTRGHRFMSSGDIRIARPSDYVSALKDQGSVLVDTREREEKVRRDVTAAAKSLNGTVAAAAELYEEVSSLTEWPVAMTCAFDESFLDLPPEVIMASLTGHQRYFPVVDSRSGKLLSQFVVVANLDSKNPALVREGNERVIRPRLSDAAFFWNTDRKLGLKGRRDALDKVVYQQGLGSMREKSDRVAKLCQRIAKDAGADPAVAARAAELAKCDLLSGMVGEFPELQGLMGSYYATSDGEKKDVATAIGEQYLPRFAGDVVPATKAGQVLALADKLDTLAGIFALGKKPSGNKDPFGLRRAALGVIRILIECNIETNLADAVAAAVALQPVKPPAGSDTAAELRDYIMERLRGYYVDGSRVTSDMFDAVASVSGNGAISLPDFEQRMEAVKAFATMPQAESLAAANKRISNILQQSGQSMATSVDPALLQEAAEKDLATALNNALADVAPLQSTRDYSKVLARLADLREPVDRFFDDVMVMAEDEALKNNRLALLSCLREPFQSVADISRLTPAKPQD